jgi:hypothetical protein
MDGRWKTDRDMPVPTMATLMGPEGDMMMIFAASCRIERATKWNMRSSVMEYADERAVYCRRLACVMEWAGGGWQCGGHARLLSSSNELRDANVAQRQTPWARRTRAGSLTKTAWPYRTPRHGSPAGTP